MRHAARKDANHNPIEAIFRQMLGDHVTDTSSAGIGLGDLYVSWGAFPGVFIEIKKDAKADYTAHQIRFQNTHPHAVIRCDSVDEAVKICKWIRAQAADIAVNKIIELAGQ